MNPECRRSRAAQAEGAGCTAETRQSALVSEQARGRADHESHGHIVQQANLGRRAATLLFVLGLAGIAAGPSCVVRPMTWLLLGASAAILVLAAIAKGLGDDDFCSTVKVLEDWAGATAKP